MPSTLAAAPQAIQAIQQSSYDQTTLTYASDGVTVTNILFSGLSVTLSSLANQFPYTGGQLLIVYADTLIVDVPNFNALAVTIVARNVDVTQLDGQDWLIQMPASGPMYPVLECLMMNTISNGQPVPLTFTTCETLAPPANQLYTAPSNAVNGLLNIGSISVNADSSISVIPTATNDFIDLIDRPYALNAFYAGFDYATSLIGAGGQASNDEAYAILSWICNAIIACGTVSPTHQEIFSQASSLLVSLNVPADYHYLGVLSPSFYSTQITDLINVVSDYETNLGNLMAQASTQNIISTISAAMSASAAAEMAPATVELAQVNSAIASIYTEIGTITNNIANQVKTADTALAVLNSAIAQSQIQQFITDSVKTTTDTVGAIASIAGVASGDGKGAGAALGGIATAVQDGIVTIKGVTKTYNTGTLTTTAQTLLKQNKELLSNTLTSAQLWYQVSNGYTPGMAFSPTPVTIDPNMAWDNFMAEATAVLSSLDASFPVGANFAGAQQQSALYLASLQELANYGKAFNGQMIAYSKQLCQGIVLVAKQAALNNIQSIWNDLASGSQNHEEQLVAMQGLIKNRINATKRSLFIAWTNYRSAYLYNMLSEPTQNITMHMSATGLAAAFSTIQNWVAGMPQNGSAGTTQLPNDNATITLNIPVIYNESAALPSQGLFAVVTPTPSDPTYAATITLSISNRMDQFSSQIGTGEVAIWITKGTFIFNGIGANSAGYVPMEVSTSGQYVNGYSNDLMYFVSNAISSHFSYQPDSGTGIKVNVPWQINNAAYMLPTPYTLWTFKIDNGCDVSSIASLDMALTVNLMFQN